MVPLHEEAGSVLGERKVSNRFCTVQVYLHLCIVITSSVQYVQVNTYLGYTILIQTGSVQYRCTLTKAIQHS